MDTGGMVCQGRGGIRVEIILAIDRAICLNMLLCLYRVAAPLEPQVALICHLLESSSSFRTAQSDVVSGRIILKWLRGFLPCSF